MVIYGKQPVLYILRHHPKKVVQLYLAKELVKKEFAQIQGFGCKVQRISQNAADKMCKNSNHQGFLCEIEEPALPSYRSFLQKEFIAVLSSVTDVGNIGGIIRTAYALGVDGVIVTGIKQLKLEPIIRSSTGVLLDMPLVAVHNTLDVLNDLKMSGFTLYGAAMDGEDIKSVDITDAKKALILGSEGAGLTKKIETRLDKKVAIRMEHGFDSLNVGAAAAILLDRMRG
jgi:23S rRNA (guanosine2251-2'-O)-methyltransferase